jgi:hypothetical protein
VDPFLISLGLQGVSAVGSWWSKQAGAEQVDANTAESVRRFKAQAAMELGAAKAAGAASGVESDSASLNNVVGRMATEYKRQADLLLRAGDIQSSAISQAGTFGLLGDLGGAIFSYGRNAGWGKG